MYEFINMQNKSTGQYLKQGLTIIFLVINVLLFVFYIHSIAAFAAFMLLFFIALLLVPFGYKTDILLLFLSGVLSAVFFYWYWQTFYGLPYFQGRKTDDWNYDNVWSKGFYDAYGLDYTKIMYFLGITFNSPGYVYLVAIFRKFGSFFDSYSTFIPRIFNVFVLAFTAYYAGRSVPNALKNKEVNGNIRQIERMAMYSVFFFPTMLFNATLIFRDTIVSFCIVHIFYLLFRYKLKVLPLVLVVIDLLILFTLRQAAFLISLLLIPIILIPPKKWKYVIIFVGLGLFIIATTYFSAIIHHLGILIESYGELNTERMGGLGSRVFGLPYYIGFIPRIVFMIFTPVPSLATFDLFYISISAFLQILFFPFLLFGLFNGKIDLRLKLTFLLFFLGVAMSTATFRHVSMYLPLGAIVVLLQYKFQANKFSTKYFLALGGLFLAFCFTILAAYLL